MAFSLFLRVPQELLYHLHLAGCKDALVAFVTHVLQGLKEASCLAEFLAEEVYGTLVAVVGVVEEGQAAEAAHVAAGSAGIVWGAFHGIIRS